jgi:hypothetical protein
MAAISDIEQAFSVTFTDDEWLEMYAGKLAELIDVLLLKAVR